MFLIELAATKNMIRLKSDSVYREIVNNRIIVLSLFQ